MNNQLLDVFKMLLLFLLNWWFSTAEVVRIRNANWKDLMQGQEGSAFCICFPSRNSSFLIDGNADPQERRVDGRVLRSLVSGM